MRRFWKYALVTVVAFLVGGTAVASAASIKQFVLSSEDGTRAAVISPEGRLHTDVAGSVEVSNLPLAPDGSVRVAPQSPEGATLLQSLDVELTAETDEFTPWINAQGFTRFLLYTRHDRQTPGNTSTSLDVGFRESLDGVLNYGDTTSRIRTQHTIAIDESGSPCTGGDCPRRDSREVKVLDGDFFYLQRI